VSRAVGRRFAVGTGVIVEDSSYSPGVPRFDHVLFDLDGTLLVGSHAVPGAPEAVEALRAAGVTVGFVTNDPVHSRDEQVVRLAAEGIRSEPNEFITSGRAVALLVADELGPVPVIALGSPAFKDECIAAGLEPVPGPGGAAAVLLGGSRTVTFDDLTVATRAVLVHGAALYASSQDATFPAPDGPVPGAGAFVAALERATGATVRCAGKPDPAMFEEARDTLGAGRYLVVGDRLDSDIAGGAAARMQTALVLTGSSSLADVAAWTGAGPDHVLAGPGDVVALVLGDDQPVAPTARSARTSP
jgi:glycerol 3-phosphatase-2